MDEKQQYKWATTVRAANKKEVKFLTLNPFKLSTTHASKASLPTVTVTLGMGSANLGYIDSAKILLYRVSIS